MLSLVAAAALATACGGAQDDAPDVAPATTGPTEAQIVFRERMLDEIESGDYTCHCTGALRARERMDKADPP